MRTIVRDLDGTLLTRGGHGYADATAPPAGSLDFLRGRGLARDWSPPTPRAPGLHGGGAPPPASTTSGVTITLRDDAPSQEEVAAPGGTLAGVSVSFNNARWAAEVNGDMWAVYEDQDGYVRLIARSDGKSWEEVYVSGEAGYTSMLGPSAKPALAVLHGAATGGRDAVILAWFRSDLDVAVVELTRKWSALFGRFIGFYDPLEYQITNGSGGTDVPALSLAACQTGTVYVAWAMGGALEWIRSSSAGDWGSVTVRTVDEPRDCRFPTLACSGLGADGERPAVLLAWKTTDRGVDNIAFMAGWVDGWGGDDLEGTKGTPRMPEELTRYSSRDNLNGRDPCAWASQSGTFFIGFDRVAIEKEGAINDIYVASASAAEVTTGTFGTPVLVSTHHRSERVDDKGLVAGNFVSGAATDDVTVVAWEEGPLPGNGAGAPTPFCREIYLATALVSAPNEWTQWGGEPATDATAAFIPTDELDPATDQGQYPCVVLTSTTAIRGGDAEVLLSLFWIWGQDEQLASIRLLQGDVDVP